MGQREGKLAGLVCWEVDVENETANRAVLSSFPFPMAKDFTGKVEVDQSLLPVRCALNQLYQKQTKNIIPLPGCTFPVLSSLR